MNGRAEPSHDGAQRRRDDEPAAGRAAAQSAVARARAGLLGGRGPDASPQEIALAQTPARLGGVSTAEYREAEAGQTALVRGAQPRAADPAAATSEPHHDPVASTRRPRDRPVRRPDPGAGTVLFVAALTVAAVTVIRCAAGVAGRRRRTRGRRAGRDG